jgi:predicted ATPase
MYIQSVQIKNIRSINDLHWSIGNAKAAGWHVVIGDNGAGKSSFLRSIALALVGPKEAFALRQNWNDWLSRGRPSGFVRLGITYDYALDKFSGSGNTPYGTIIVRVNFSRQQNDVDLKATTQRNANRTVWGNKSGWFSASYGPFRRFAGGDNAVERIFITNPKLASHLSVFGITRNSRKTVKVIF